MHGTIISAPEVTNISRHGFWLLLGDEELAQRRVLAGDAVVAAEAPHLA